MLILQWKELVGSVVPAPYQDVSGRYPWPQSVMASVIPIAAPHSLINISAELLQLVEDLRMYVFSAARKGKKIFLPEASVAILMRNGNVSAVYSSKEKTDMGSWLQKFSPWDRDHQLYVADSQRFSLQFSVPSNHDPLFFLQGKMELTLAAGDYQPLLFNWLRLRPFLHLWDIYEFGEGLLKSCDLLLYSPQELLKSKTRQEQTEKRAIAKLEKEWLSCGITLCRCELSWQSRPAAAQTISQKVKSICERNVENMERERLEQDLWDARYASSRGKQVNSPDDGAWEDQLSQSQQASHHNLQVETAEVKNKSQPELLGKQKEQGRELDEKLLSSHSNLHKEMIQQETGNKQPATKPPRAQQMPDLPALGPSLAELACETKSAPGRPPSSPKPKAMLEEHNIIEHKRRHERNEMALEEKNE